VTSANAYELPPHSSAPAEAVDAAEHGEVVYLMRGGQRFAAIVPPDVAAAGAAAVEALEDAHRLVDAMPDDRLDAVSEVVRAAAQTGEQPWAFPPQSRPPLAAEPVRTFASAGALSAEHDLAERVEDILRTEDHDAA
jgi:hypothetical protein